MAFLTDLLDLLLEGEGWEEKMKERIRKETEEMNHLLEEADGLSKLALEVQNIVLDKVLFGCQRGNVLRILSVVLKENIRDFREDVRVPPFSIVKFRDNYSGGYEPGKLYLYLGNVPRYGRIASGPAGGLGDGMSTRRGSLQRIEREEIEGFLKSLRFQRLVRGVGHGFE